MKRVEGVVVVENPKTPICDRPDLSLSTDLRIGAEESRDEYLFARIRSIAVDENGKTYIVDHKLNIVKAFDKEVKFLQTIGRAGL